MSGTIVGEGKHSFYRIEMGADYDGGFEFRMIAGNQPDLLLKLHLVQDNHTTHLDYNVSGLVSLESCKERSIDYLYGIVSSLDRLGDLLAEYLLTPDGLRLDPESVFIRRETGQVYFCYVPGCKEPFQQSLQALMEYFMKVSAPAEEQDVLLLYGLYQKSREKTVTPGVLAEYWRESQKRNRDPEVVFPEIAEPETVSEEADIYAELGMEKPRPGRRLLLGKRDAEGPKEQNKPAPDRGQAWTEKEPSRQKGSLSGGRMADRFTGLLKGHLSEVIIAAVVVVGAILIIFL